MRVWNQRVCGVVVAAGLALAFATPLRALWLHESAPWWSVFVLWGAAVGALLVPARAADAEDGMGSPAKREP